jgi:hypothetical protein
LLEKGAEVFAFEDSSEEKNGGEGLPFWVNPYKEAESFLFSKNKTKYQGEFYGITYFIEDGF